MEKKLTILLVEDDNYTCNQFAMLIDKSDDLKLVGVANNSVKSLTIIKDTHPDVIILDLELHHGGGSGLDVLKGLKDLDLKVLPYILITTNNSSNVTYDTARRLGADYIMSKHQDDYSESSVLDFLRMISSSIKNARRLLIAENKLQDEAPEYFEQRITKRIMAELDIIGINQKVIGYQYLVEAIKILINQPTQNICSIIAKEHQKTEASVERAMQNAINRAWATANIDDLLVHYTAKIGSYKGVPTLMEFTYYYANKLKNEYSIE